MPGMEDIWHRDRAAYYEPPSVGLVAIAPVGDTVIVPEDYDRVALIISLSGGGPVFIVPAGTGSGAGLQLVTASPIIQLAGADYWPIIRESWTGNTTAPGTSVVAVSISLTRSPDQYEGYDVYAEPREQQNQRTGRSDQYANPLVLSPSQAPVPERPQREPDYYQLWRSRCSRSRQLNNLSRFAARRAGIG